MSYKIGVLGTGVMGGGIARALAQSGIDVLFCNVRPGSVERGYAKVEAALRKSAERGFITQEQLDATLSRITPVNTYEALAGTDMVIEAIYEERDVKEESFRALGGVCPEKTVLATNTSSLYVRDIAAVTRFPERVIGTHYFFPSDRNKLVEIIPHAGTSDAALALAREIAALHGKTAITVSDSPGFVVNRIFIPYYVHSIRMLERGLGNIPTIDAAEKKAFGIPMGAFEVMNVTGVPIAAHSADTLGVEFSEFYSTPALLRKTIDEGREWDLAGDIDESKFPAITDYICGVTLGVAAQLVGSGVANVRDTDLGVELGLRWRVGPFKLINELGVKRALELVEAVSAANAGFDVPELLKTQAASGKPFDV
ncbi:MAG: 3-hydroxyacyl-CoA dehydrogenase family protein [Oscillospiraceae bacterium]|jgi:enoyl-CoA hydratase/3-hydroxyacyl-CoA dehydrogenase|nr:3-hydroxyacyl-CoA dehydrogenase family protein [Oscillospiraceae bacterium]